MERRKGRKTNKDVCVRFGGKPMDHRCPRTIEMPDTVYYRVFSRKKGRRREQLIIKKYPSFGESEIGEIIEWYRHRIGNIRAKVVEIDGDRLVVELISVN